MLKFRIVIFIYYKIEVVDEISCDIVFLEDFFILMEGIFFRVLN